MVLMYPRPKSWDVIDAVAHINTLMKLGARFMIPFAYSNLTEDDARVLGIEIDHKYDMPDWDDEEGLEQWYEDMGYEECIEETEYA